MLQVMSGQVDVGYDGNGGLGVPEFERGAVRVVALGSELTSMENVTTRGLVVTAETLAKRRDTLIRFVQAYQKTVDWMYHDPAALKQYAEMSQAKLEDAKRIVEWMYPERAMRMGDVGGIEVSIEQGLQFKRIAQRPTAEQLTAAIESCGSRAAREARPGRYHDQGPASRWAPRIVGAGFCPAS